MARAGHDGLAEDRPRIVIITPAFNEGQNLRQLDARLQAVLQDLEMDWRWIIIDDHSSDDTFDVIKSFCNRDSRISGIRLSRNFGSHKAFTCGLHHAAGDCAVLMAADLQDPPEIIPELVQEWQKGHQVVWAVRAGRPGVKKSSLLFSRLYYWIMRNIVGLKEIPASGADFWLMDRVVIDCFKQFKEQNVSILALISWMGFRQKYIYYEKQPRMHGESGWSFGKKLTLMIDSITSFSLVPLRLMSLIGFVVAFSGFIYAGIVILNRILGSPPQGWTGLMVAVLVIGGIQMMMLGVLGEYLWRSLGESRQRPLYIIEEKVERQASDDQGD